MSVMDTPTKAAQCPRPKTRGWLDLVRAAREDEAEAARLRAELKRYLAGADRLSARRAARRGGPPLPAAGAASSRTAPGRTAGDRAPSPPRKKKKVPDDEPERAAEPLIPDWSSKPVVDVVAALATLSTPWTLRMAALRAVRERAGEMAQEEALISGLCVQLDDLRSKIVVESAETVLALASYLSESQCVAIFSAAMAGIAVKKAVMGDARESAMKGAMRPAGKYDAAWEAVREAVSSARHERGRRVGVDVVAEWVAEGPIGEERDGVVMQVLAKGVVDKAAVVREAAKKLEKAYTDKQGVERSRNLRMMLPADARSRLGGTGSSSGTQKGGRRNLTGRPNMKELIRQKKMAMMKTEAAKKAAAFKGNENTPPAAGNVGENLQTEELDKDLKGSKSRE